MSYTTYRAVPAYLERESAGPALQYLEAPTAADPSKRISGMRWKAGFFCSEAYFGDEEPSVLPDGPPRLLMWQRTSDQTPVKGWWRSYLPLGVGCTGHVDVTDPANYFRPWSENVKRQRKRWLANPDVHIRDIDLKTYLSAYAETRPRFKMRGAFSKQLQTKEKYHPGLVRLWGAFRPNHTLPFAGFAALDLPEANATIHVTSFYDPGFNHLGVCTGLVDHWFSESIKRGLRYMDFDLFWRFGDPSEWKGFSKFKKQFGTKLIMYPRPCLKIVGGRGMR